MSSESTKSKDENLQVLAEHYQKTFELADGLRRDRNKFFIFLVAMLAGVTAFLGLGKERALRMLAAWMSASISFDKLDPNTYADLSPDALAQWFSGTNFSLLLTMTLAIVFYFMMNLYHHTATVNRLYAYLGKLETEIGASLPRTSNAIAFTREGNFYDAHNTRWLKSIGLAYSIVLTILLGSFFILVWLDLHYVYYYYDLALTAIRVGDVIISLATGAYLIAYWLVSFRSLNRARIKQLLENFKSSLKSSNARK